MRKLVVMIFGCLVSLGAALRGPESLGQSCSAFPKFSLQR